MVDDFIKRMKAAFPDFANKLVESPQVGLEQVRPPISEVDLNKLETSLGLQLPESYKSFLRCARQFWLFGGIVQFGTQHPFFHEFEPFDKLPPKQQLFVKQRSGRWPPPSQGMLCFAEFFMEADGDQVLFDVSKGLVNDEYPIMYYDHETPSVRRLADTLSQFLTEFLDYPAFALEGDFE